MIARIIEFSARNALMILLASVIAAVIGVLVLIGIVVGIWLFLRGYKQRVLRKNSGFRR